MIDTKKIADVMDMDVFEPAKKQLPTVELMDDEANEETKADFAYVRSNIYSLVEAGKQAIEEAMTVASSEESPRGFEVVGGLLKNVSEVNKQLMDIHKQRQEMTAPAKETTVNNNAVFVGSTAELMKLLGKQ